MAQFSYLVKDYFLVLIFFLPLLYFIIKQFKTFAKSKEIPPFPPGPTPWPLLGNIPHMLTKMPHVALTDYSKIYGPLMMFRFGTQKMEVASSPATAKEILKTHDLFLSARYLPKSIPPEELTNRSIIWTETSHDSWKSLRTLCKNELFSLKKLDSQSSLRDQKISEMIDHVEAKKEVNIANLVFVTVFNMLSNVFFSSDLMGFDEKSEGSSLKSLFKKMSENASEPNIADLYPILSRFDLQGLRRSSRKMSMKVRASYEHIKEERRKENPPFNRNDFLDVLLQNKFSDTQIIVLTQLAQTSTSIVEWVMAELLMNPESMAKVIEELDKEVGTCHLVRESRLTQLNYLHACIKETLRLHPPGPLLLPRRALRTCHVMNYIIPENAQIYINIWAMGRDPTIWDEPLTFKPERFLNSAVDFKGNDFEFLPFGGGRRICPGLSMAGRQVPLILSALLHAFDWSLLKEKDSQQIDMTEKFGISLHKEQPLVLIPKQKR